MFWPSGQNKRMKMAFVEMAVCSIEKQKKTILQTRLYLKAGSIIAQIG